MCIINYNENEPETSSNTVVVLSSADTRVCLPKDQRHILFSGTGEGAWIHLHTAGGPGRGRVCGAGDENRV